MAPPAASNKPKAPPRNLATPYSLQAYALEKLLHDPTKPVSIPAPPPTGVKVLRAPRDQMKNVQGSSAGAGSGEFHVYKESRRREYERIQLMEEEDRLNETEAATQLRALTNATAAEEKTAKNRLKRQKKKSQSRNNGKKEVEATSAFDTTTGDFTSGGTGDKKRKLGGAGVKFMKAGERQDEDDEAEDGGDREEAEEEEEGAREIVGLKLRTLPVVSRGNEESESPVEVNPAKEAGIVIRDED